MPDPEDRHGEIYNDQEHNVADWDEETRQGGSTDVDTGHHTVYGTVDDDPYRRSWEEDGSEDHSTFYTGWSVDHE
jgi:hypothetical protein